MTDSTFAGSPDPVGAAFRKTYADGYLAGQLAMRARAAMIATNPYSDEVQAYGGRRLGDEPFAVGRKIAVAISALQPEAPAQ